MIYGKSFTIFFTYILSGIESNMEKSMNISFNLKKNDETKIWKRENETKITESDEPNVLAFVIHKEPEPEKIFNDWANPYIGLYPFMKLLGGSGDELAFGKEDKIFTTTCVSIVQSGYLIKGHASVLHKILIEHNIIGVDTTYGDVKNNFPLMKTLMSKLSCGLETDPKKSLYGCQIVSDFDLAVNLQRKL